MTARPEAWPPRAVQQHRTWCWPVDATHYDRTPSLSPVEWAALVEAAARRARWPQSGHWPAWVHTDRCRLLCPLSDVLALTGARGSKRIEVLGLFLSEMHRTRMPFWAWPREEWLAFLGRDDGPRRHHLLAVSYLLCGLPDLHTTFPKFKVHAYATKLFGRDMVDDAVGRVRDELFGWGYSQRSGTAHFLVLVLPALLLACGSPRLQDLTAEAVAAVGQQAMSKAMRRAFAAGCRAIAALGVPLPLADDTVPVDARTEPPLASGVPTAWGEWCRRWWQVSTLQRRRSVYYKLLIAGRWLATARPDLADPAAWDRRAAAEYVAAVDRMTVGQWANPASSAQRKATGGHPLNARSKQGYLVAMRTFFADCQELLGLPRRFDPKRAFATPPSVKALLGPDPRVIADDVWGKLFTAGLNLTLEDVTPPGESPLLYPHYPLAMVQAIAVVWLCAGLRSDELRRLPVGCARWQREDVVVPGTGDVLPKDAVCILHVPANKYNAGFHKPVDKQAGQTIAEWAALRPAQPPFRDRKTGESVHYLFAWRGKRLGEGYLNRFLIPLLCRKAGVPTHDARGNITSHRARSTIASQLFNAKEPMSLFELKEWLGHVSLESTQHYVAVAPTRLAKSFADADYFRRNVRTVEVLIDQEAIKTGAAAQGAPWLLYDLGHGYCSYDYFEQCPHRMACAKCTFYLPKGSTRAQLMEGKANLLRMRQEFPLREEERAAVDDGLEALEHLLAQLADAPTPDGGPTPRQRNPSSPHALPVLPPGRSG